ncbi:MAG: universal stress protein [Gordonia sp. (in: high G+C Gram-positive bacteria)]
MAIGVAFSTTPAGHAALQLAAQEAVIHQTNLVVLTLAESPERVENPEQLATVRAEVSESLAEVPAGQTVSWSVVTEANQGSLAAALIDLAEANDVDILVIGSRRRSAVSKLIMGSTVRQVVLDAPMPVVVVKSPEF